MIINISRMKSFLLCKEKAFNIYHRRLSTSPTMNMSGGSGFHRGVAVGLAERDWRKAEGEMLTTFKEEMRVEGPLPEEQPLWDQQAELLRAMLALYRINYEQEKYQVVQPECEFTVELPHSGHNCIWLHHLENTSTTVGLTRYEERWGPPSWQAILEGRVASPHGRWDHSCSCYQPHRLTGKTDAIVVWNGFLWLLEHKTTSILGQPFWDEWLLNIQPTGYMWGVKRALGIEPKGFVVNAMYRPSENQVRSWNDKRKSGPHKAAADYIKFERQAFTRTQEDLDYFERQLRWVCDEWEERIISGRWPMSNIQGACMLYNRLCDFHGVCLAHGSPESLDSFLQGEPDYVMKQQQELLQIEGGVK